jgi:hypothetical protein
MHVNVGQYVNADNYVDGLVAKLCQVVVFIKDFAVLVLNVSVCAAPVLQQTHRIQRTT